MPTVWREPREETEGLYPGLVVHDGRVGGSITVGRSRLPLWAFMGVAIQYGWDEAEAGWTPSEYGMGPREAARFVYDLLEARGEFARLLLMLADASRRQDEADDEAEAFTAPWWECPEIAEPIAEQLRRCLVCLEGEPAWP